MGLSWQQGPLGRGAVGRFVTPDPIPEPLLFAEPLRRRMRVQYAGEWIADSEDVLLLHEPGHYPIALFPLTDVRPDVLQREHRTTRHPELGDMGWFTVTAGGRSASRAAWEYAEPPGFASELAGRVAFAWRAMDAFYEEDERIVGHAADPYHRIDIRRTSRHLVVRDGEQTIADSTRPLALYESGFAPRWYVTRADIDEAALKPNDTQTFCPYKGLGGYYDIGDHGHAAWSYREAWPEVASVSDLVSFEPDKIEVYLDGVRLHLEPGQNVITHGIDRDLDPDEILASAANPR